MQADLDRFALDGPEMDISPQATLSLSLLLHELATNALKYGALSAAAGKVRIAWRTEEGSAPTLVLDWDESGGPAVAAPKGRGGFGSKLIAWFEGTGCCMHYNLIGLGQNFAPAGRSTGSTALAHAQSHDLPRLRAVRRG